MKYNLLNVNDISFVKQPTEGDVVCTEDDIKFYENNEWCSLSKLKHNQMTVYDFNKNLMVNAPKMSHKDIQSKAQLFYDYMKQVNNEYYMLVNNELKYYTFFTQSNTKTRSFMSYLNSCFQSLKAEILSIENDRGQAIEIWVRINDQPHVFYFFAYDMGVIKYEADLL